jgi:hypothetical protein
VNTLDHLGKLMSKHGMRTPSSSIGADLGYLKKSMLNEIDSNGPTNRAAAKSTCIMIKCDFLKSKRNHKAVKNIHELWGNPLVKVTGDDTNGLSSRKQNDRNTMTLNTENTTNCDLLLNNFRMGPSPTLTRTRLWIKPSGAHQGIQGKCRARQTSIMVFIEVSAQALELKANFIISPNPILDRQHRQPVTG